MHEKLLVGLFNKTKVSNRNITFVIVHLKRKCLIYNTILKRFNILISYHFNLQILKEYSFLEHYTTAPCYQNGAVPLYCDGEGF